MSSLHDLNDIASGDPDAPGEPLLADRPAGPGGRALAYVCRGFVCDAPIADPDELAGVLSPPPARGA